MKPTILKDSQGNELERETVYDLAWANVHASFSKNELVSAYLDDLMDSELIEWAEDENGEFPQ